MKKVVAIALSAFFLFAAFFPVFASEGEAQGAEPGFGITILGLALILLSARFFGMIEKFGQPAVLGELAAGIALGNLALLGINFFEPFKENIFLKFLSELGVLILLFQVGLESNIRDILKVGLRAFVVACVGVVVPFWLGAAIAGPILLPGLAQSTYIFIGATLTATSVGITARVFKDLGKLNTPEARIVLGAAVIDDVLGLIILAVVSALVSAGTIQIGSVAIITLKAALFLLLSLVLGQIFAPWLGRIMSRINTGAGMKFALAMTIAFVYAFIAEEIGLAPIVGAFAAGLILDPVHFKFFREPGVVEELKGVVKKLSYKEKERISNIIDRQSKKHVEDLIEPVSLLLVPVFFVFTGMGVDLRSFADLRILGLALGVTVVAFAGKYVSGFFAGKVDKNIVGIGMIPRGEVGLIFATMGKGLGVISDEIFSVFVIMIVATTLVPPILLNIFLKKKEILK